MPEIPTPSAVDVLTQLVTGPSLWEVATNTLRPALKTLYPELELDPRQTLVVTPVWQIDGDRVIPGRSRSESLTNVLVRLGLGATTVTWIDGEHYLVRRSTNEQPVTLAVKIDALARLINELAPLLFVAYQEQQIDYWNEPTGLSHPRWYSLSDALRALWDVKDTTDWDEHRLAMARAVFADPDKTQRLPRDKYKTRAYLIDVDAGDEVQRRHLHVLDTAVLVGSVAGRTLILSHSLPLGFQRFDSFEELGEAIRNAYPAKAVPVSLNWRLIEPEGNFFDRQACILIALEADAIGTLGSQPSTRPGVLPHPGTLGRHTAELPPQLQPQAEHLRPLLPSWLDQARADDQTCYSRHLLDLVLIQHQNAGKTFQNEVPDLRTFTLEALSAQIRREQPQTNDVRVDNLEISITSLVVWGTFMWPGNTETLTLSLTDLALQNLAGLPPGNKVVRCKDGTPVPDWMSADYLERLVTTVDIGARYPAMLKRCLVEDSTRASTLQRLYTRQLAAELPLLALQHKIRGEMDIDEQGYRYIVAALADTASERQVDGQQIVVRPLAFIVGQRPRDIVANMFIIGPRQTDQGPCLLYRPLLDPPLIQYASPANLLYAIKHSRSIRQAVLAWLPDDVRFNYEQYVFPARLPSIWTIPQSLVDPSAALDMSGPVSLASDVIEDPILPALFNANVQAMLTQSDRQSVSNAEARWASLKNGGWRIFNAALPFLGRSVGTAAWIWQIIDDLQAMNDAANEAPARLDWSALADILLALGMVLAHRAAVGRRPVHESPASPQTVVETPARTLSPAIKVLRLPDIGDRELSASHDISVNAIGALDRSQPGLGSLLDSLQVPRPEGLGDAQGEGPYQHLHAHGHAWYAAVGQRWFEVIVNDDERVQISDSRQQPARTGPLLTHNADGQWFVDLRLRLNGGGLRSRLRKLQDDNRARLIQMKAALTDFDATLQAKQTQLKEVREAMLQATPDNRPSAREQFLDTLEVQIRAYGEHIQQLKAMNVVEPIPNYRTAMIERLSLQLFLVQSWLDEQSSEFRSSLSTTLALLDEPSAPLSAERNAPFTKASDMTQGMIDKIEYARSRLDELSLLGRDALEVTRDYKAKLPRYTIDDLKLLQITLEQELCIRPDLTQEPVDARLALENLIDDAALNIQSSLEVSNEESLQNLSQRIETMSNLAEQFVAVDQRFADLLVEYPEQLLADRIEQVRRRVAGFADRTVDRLVNLLRDKRQFDPVPGPSKPSTASAKKVIKTRYKGTVVGEPRKDASGRETDLVDVRAPLTGKIIATFHEKSPGVWLERVTPKPVSKGPAPSLHRCIEEGQALIDGLPAFHRRTEAHINRAARIPSEIQDLYYLHADRLREARDAIDRALTARNLTDDRNATASTLNRELADAATALYQRGQSARIRIIKQQPPTAARVEWLKSKGQVDISKATARQRLKGSGKGYLDEYEVLDHETHAVLWYAHFHYSGINDPVTAFNAAHLKTVEQRRLGGRFDPRTTGNQELIAIYRGEINRAQAAALFFS